VLDDGQDVLAPFVQGDGLDEIGGQQGVGLGAQEVGPRARCPFGRRIEPFLLEGLPDGGGRDLDAKRGELSVDPPVAPAGFSRDQAQDESADGADRGRAARPHRPAGTGMAQSHQITVPAQDGVLPDEEP
jgi:hypothetical protein